MSDEGTRTAIVQTDTPAAIAGRIFNLDLAQPVAFALLAMVYIASRMPFVNLGYGTDPDSWRIALTGLWLWDHGEYFPSRLPGYPLPELASAAVIKGGSLATNTLTVAVSILGLWFFARIASKLELPNRALIVIAFAFTPLLWINSMTTMDYMYALTFVLGAYYFLVVGDSFVAGIMLGLAVASRSTSIVMLLPMLLYIWRDGRRSEIRGFVVSVVFVALVFWAPIYWRYNLSFFEFYDAKVRYLNVLRLLGKDCLGLIGAIAVLIAIAVSLPRLIRLPVDFLRDRHVQMWVLAIAGTVIVFLRLPHEAAYLIPVYPFGFFLMARYFKPAVLAPLVGVIILAGFVDLTSPGDEITSETFTSAELGRGLVLSNADTMRAQRDFAESLLCRPTDVSDVCQITGVDGDTFRVPSRSYVMVGFAYPQFAVLHYDDLNVRLLNDEEDKSSISQLSDGGETIDATWDIHYVWLLDWKTFDARRNVNYNIRSTLDAARSVAGLYGYRPGLFCPEPLLEEKGHFRSGCVLDFGRGPSGGSGAARTDR